MLHGGGGLRAVGTNHIRVRSLGIVPYQLRNLKLGVYSERTYATIAQN